MPAIIPFSVLPPTALQSTSPHFRAPAGLISALVPSLKESLLQAGYEYGPREYAGMALIAGLANGAMFFLLISFLSFATRTNLYLLAAGLGLLVFLASLVTIVFYPRVVAKKRARSFEAYMIPAVQQLMIELKSGVPLFNAMASLTRDYGEVGDEFRVIIQRINSGTSDLDALADSAMSNPSPQFRKVLWQISNSLKVGSDLASVLESLVQELMRERVDQIRQYGQELSPWTMIYMMAAVILPSLGVAMLIVIVGFLNVAVPKIILAVIVAGLLGFQLFFMNFVASRRPAV